jgi:hypothetical protein
VFPVTAHFFTHVNRAFYRYELDESANWAITMESLEENLAQSKVDGLTVKALAMINPGTVISSP